MYASSGFDPAGVLYKEKTEDRLRSDSAEFVDVIHTSTNILGHSMPMGHIDIYPNGGKAPQPGCGWDVTGTECCFKACGLSQAICLILKTRHII